MDPGPAPPTSREGEDGRGRQAQGGSGGGGSSRHPAAAAGPCGGAQGQQGEQHDDDEWASQLWMENAHWALLGECHPDRCVCNV